MTKCSKILTGAVGALLLSYGSMSQAQNVPLAQSFDYENRVYPFSLSGLPYSYDGLEPHIMTDIVRAQHAQHHKDYIDRLNIILAENPALQTTSLRNLLINLDALPEDIRAELQTQAGGTYNHALFSILMHPYGGGTPVGKVATVIDNTFGSFDEFKNQFAAAAQQAVGSGWVWLCVDKDEKLVIVVTPGENNPLSQGLTPILGLDMWDHAYLPQYQDRPLDYVQAWWNIVHWLQVEVLYRKTIVNLQTAKE